MLFAEILRARAELRRGGVMPGYKSAKFTA
jgi:hypothetical protein